MSYASVRKKKRSALGAIPAEALPFVEAAAKQLVTVYGQNKPEAKLAGDLLLATLSGNQAAFQAATNAAIQTVATTGAVAACAATGIGAAAAPVCGFIGGKVGGAVSGLLFPSAGKESCGQALVRVREATMAGLKPSCNGDEACLTEVYKAAHRFAERSLFSCARTDGWSMKPQIEAEARRLGVDLNAKMETFAFNVQGWEPHTKNILTSEAGAAILQAKMRRWDELAKKAKAHANAEYDVLVKDCPATVAIKGAGLSPCKQKAADAAITIAARTYLYEAIDGASTIAALEMAAIRSQFRAELAQDEAIRTGNAAASSLAERAAAEDRALLSAALRSQAVYSPQAKKTAALLGVAGLVVAGLLYARQTGRL